jgi:hypothetical protein
MYKHRDICYQRAYLWAGTGLSVFPLSGNWVDVLKEVTKQRRTQMTL